MISTPREGLADGTHVTPALGPHTPHGWDRCGPCEPEPGWPGGTVPPRGLLPLYQMPRQTANVKLES